MLSRAELKQQAKEQLRGNVGSYFLVFLAYFGIAIAIELVGIVLAMIFPLLGFIAIYAGILPLILGFYMVFLNGTYGEQPKASTLLEGYKKEYFGKSILLVILVGIFTALWSLLLIIPGLIMAIAYSMSWYILAENPDMTALEAIKESKEIMKGHKMDFFVLGLSFIPWMIVYMFTFGIAGIWILPYMQLTITNFYHNIKGHDTVPVAPVYETSATDAAESTNHTIVY